MATDKKDIKADFIAKAADLAPFLQDFWPPQNWEGILKRKQNQQLDSKLLAQVLKAQNQHLQASELVMEGIEALKSENTFAITTGHQVCLAGGPMFTLYKVATAISLAKTLSAQFPQYRFVPMLWMATEDHDWEEVNHFFPSFEEKRTYIAQVDGPVGRHILQDSIKTVLADQPDWLQACYAPGTSMAEAFRSLMHAIFGEQGLVVLDPDDAALKAAFMPVMEAELSGNGIGEALLAQTQALEGKGYKAQVHPRGINLFWMGDGGRKLLVETESGFSTKEGSNSWSREELIQALKAHPEDFSPNVAMRPLYQETVLPNLAYVGGWAEISYWMQFKSSFDQHAIPFPLLVPRLHATLFKSSQAEEWQNLGFELSDIAQPLHVLQEQWMARNFDQSALNAAMESVDAAYEDVAKALEAFDPTLGTGMRGEKARSMSSLENWQKKLKKSLKNRYPKPFSSIAELKQALDPENQPQQRTLNLTAFGMQPATWGTFLVNIADAFELKQKWTILP